MRYPIAVALGGIVALAAGALAILTFIDRGDERAAQASTSASTPLVETAAPVAARAVAETESAPTPSPTLAEAAPVALVGAPPSPSSSPWDDVKVATRPSELGPVAGAVNAALRGVRDQMDSCFTEESTRLASSPAPEVDPNDPPRGPAVVVLDLEGTEGGLEIVGTSLDYLGTSTREFVRCCEQHLVGVRIVAGGAKPGQRLRLKYVLQ